MIAFGFNIYYEDEPLLDDNTYDPLKKTITIFKNSSPNTFQNLAIKSDYTPMSGRMVAYGTQKPFGNCQESCQWGIDIKGVMSILWFPNTLNISYIPQDGYTVKLLQFWILHTILPMKLALENIYDILHVGAVEVNNATIIFSAESFGGKSTMTDFFIQQGHTLFSDDTLGIYRVDETFMAVPSYPFHRPYREAEALGYKITNASTTPKPIKAFFLLERALPDAPIEIIEVKGIKKYRAFHFSTFVNFDFMKETRFKRLSAIAHAIPVYVVTVPWDLKRLPEVYAKIVKYLGLK